MKPLAVYSQKGFKEKNKESFMVGIPLPNYLYDLDENIKVHNFHMVLREYHKKSGMTMRAVSKLIGVHEVTCQLYFKGKNRACLKMLKKLGEVYGVDFLQIAFDENYYFIIKKKITKLPRELTKDLAYYIGYLQGDGYLESDKKGFGFSDEYKSQIVKMNDLTFQLFGFRGKIYERVSKIALKPCYHLENNSFVVNSFIHEVFGVIRGLKTKLRIPKIILSTKNITVIYLSGLYDADGTLPKHPEKVVQFFLDITMKDKIFMQEIKNVLKSFGIPTLKLYERVAIFPGGEEVSSTWEIRIRKHSDMLKFLQTIGFHHPDKIRRQRELIPMLL